MARFSLVFVAAAVLLFVATAEASMKTIVTTTTVEENPVGRRGGSSCAEPMVEQEMLSHCRMYLTSLTGRGQGMKNPAEEHLQLCCKQLEKMGSEQCMCEGIMMMMNMQGWTQQQQQGMMSMAMNLPQQCQLMSQSCMMRAAFI